MLIAFSEYDRVARHDLRDGTVIPEPMDEVRSAERLNGVQISVVLEAHEVQHRLLPCKMTRVRAPG